MATSDQSSGRQFRTPTQGLREYRFSGASLFRVIEALPRPLREPRARSSQRSEQQLYFAQYLEELGCTHFVLEEHFIDRDFLEDFGALYSRGLVQYTSHCQRIHFFRGETTRREPIGGTRHLRRLRARIARRSAEQRAQEFTVAAQQIQSGYLGFMVLRPLPQARIGRSVIKPYVRPANDDKARDVLRLRRSATYQLHYAGFPLQGEGVAFQQQDRGTSACATTALWTAIQGMDGPRLRQIPPIQITRLANRAESPDGRALPTQGLTFAQMLEALRGLGLESFPHRAIDITSTVGMLHLAIRSRLPAIAILAPTNGEPGLHAVTILGGREAHGTPPIELQPDTGSRARHLQALYLHDDRLGPYVRANLHALSRDDASAPLLEYIDDNYPRRAAHGPWLCLDMVRRWRTSAERLLLTDLIVPIYPEIRTSFSTLMKAGEQVLPALRGALAKEQLSVALEYDLRLVRGADYARQLMVEDRIPEVISTTLTHTVALPRFVAALRIFTQGAPLFDVLYDTTATDPHFSAVALVQLDGPHRGRAVTLGRVLMEVAGAGFPRARRIMS